MSEKHYKVVLKRFKKEWRKKIFWEVSIWIRTGGPLDLIIYQVKLSRKCQKMVHCGQVSIKMVHCIADMRSRHFGIAHCVRTKQLHKLIYVPNQSQSVPFSNIFQKPILLQYTQLIFSDFSSKTGLKNHEFRSI